ncbi:hypothetical protein [Rudanella lutea]|uniref:hypothetical protein n=1 Tax=Rudanella lutea TaxID=451374 RepID=UPI0005C519D6|nr:hypothetical protein [Rudanella lutea]
MNTNLEAFRKKYHLSIGRKVSSPITEFSVSLALQYAKGIVNAPPSNRKPFYISVPDIENFTIFFGCTVLLNYLFEDYFNLEPPVLSVGDKVEIFGSVAKYIGEDCAQQNLFVRLHFRDGIINVPKSNLQHMVKVDNRRMLNTIDNFKSNRKAFWDNYDLNSLFNLNSKELVNPKALNSKVYLITGRGHVMRTRETLSNEICLNQTLEKVFQVGTNLIIAPDLKKISSTFNTSTDTDDTYFISELQEDLNEILELYANDSTVQTLVEQLYQHLRKKDFSEIFVAKFNQLANSVEDYYRNRLLILMSNMPEPKADIPENLKVVIVNGLTLITDYSNTINGLAERGIPVIILTDQKEMASTPDETVENLAKGYRFYWSRRRIKKLSLIKEDEYIDKLFWEQCIRFSSQKIIIQCFTDFEGDNLFQAFESNSDFARLEGFESFKKAYYQNLRPTLYLLKNTPGLYHKNTVREQTGIFIEEFNKIKNQLPLNVSLAVTHALESLKSYKTNSKKLPDNRYTFNQLIDFPGKPKQQTAPDTKKQFQIFNLDTVDCDSLAFTGYPYKEWNGKHLFNAVLNRFIPEVTVLAWPTEAKKTSGYLLKRIQRAGFDNYLPEWISFGISDWKIPKKESRPDESHIVVQTGCSENLSSESVNDPAEEIAVFEDVQKNINNFRFADIATSGTDVKQYIIPVNVLHFHNGFYMYVPYNSHLYTVARHASKTCRIIEATFSELRVGDVVVCFDMDREVVRKLAREKLNEAYKDLDQWRERLQTLLTLNEWSFLTLEQFLTRQKELLRLSEGSPNRQNLLRWFYERDVLAPHTSNLRLIFEASGLPRKEAEEKIVRVKSAKRLILKSTNQVAERIKDKIMLLLRDRQMLDDCMQLNIDGVTVKVQCGRVTDKEQSIGMNVPYSFTKQFLLY